VIVLGKRYFTFDNEVDKWIREMQGVMRQIGIRDPTRQDSLRAIVLQNQALIDRIGVKMFRKRKSKKEVVFG